MPFVLGLLTEDWPELEKVRGAMEETIIFDIDHNKFISQPFDDLESFPSKYAKQLLAGVEKANPYHSSLLHTIAKVSGNAPTSRQLNEKIADVFLGFFVDLLQSYPEHMFALPTSTRMVFNKESFLMSFKDETTRNVRLSIHPQDG